MKAILARPAGGFGLCEVDPPPIGPGEILLEMRACGLCGTDLVKLAQPHNSHGVTLGHELPAGGGRPGRQGPGEAAPAPHLPGGAWGPRTAGVVRAVGPGVTRFSPGDRIT